MSVSGRGCGVLLTSVHSLAACWCVPVGHANAQLRELVLGSRKGGKAKEGHGDSRNDSPSGGLHGVVGRSVACGGWLSPDGQRAAGEVRRLGSLMLAWSRGVLVPVIQPAVLWNGSSEM